MTNTFRFAAAATLAAGLFAALPAAAQTVTPASPSIAEMQARRAKPADLAAALKQRDAIVAKQAATISRLNQAKAELQQRLADNQARLAQARKVR
jgi:hypothetical protein